MQQSTVREFPGISPAAFQHPLDVQALENLEKVPLLAPLIRLVSSSVFEKRMRLASVSGMVRLGPNQGQSVYQKFVQAAKILDIPELPTIYVSNRYTVNAYAYGVENYQITLFSGLIEALTEEELLVVIAHELGHIKCEHMLYKTMAYLLRLFGAEALRNLLPVGTGALAAYSLELALLHWERMAEFSCDRASLLVVQDEQVVASALSKLAGGSPKIMPEINLAEVLTQADEYDDPNEGVIDQMLKINMMLLQTHPFPIVRVKEILDWAESEQYRRILAGDYLHHRESPALVVSEPMSRVCPNCGQLNNPAAATCLTCGSPIAGGRLVCTNCHIKVFAGWHTCPGCGSALQPAANGNGSA